MEIILVSPFVCVFWFFMEMRHLRYFVAVAEELNFRRAAERLHLSPPALSVQIRLLEEILNTRLFDRDTTGVRLTVPGEVLLREAKPLLQHIQDVVVATQDAARGKRGSLKIGCAGQLGYSFMSTALAAYRQLFPDVDVALAEINIERQQYRALERGEIQIGFLYGASNAMWQPDTCYMLILDTPIRIVMSAEHPLAASHRVSLAELSEMPLLAFGKGEEHPHAGSMRATFARRGIKPGTVKFVEGYEAFMSMLGGGRWISLLPDMSSLSMLSGIAVRPLKERGPDLRLQLYVIWKANVSCPLIENFIEILRRGTPWQA